MIGYLPPLAFSPDGRYLAAGSSWESRKDIQPVVKIWEVATGRLAHTLTLPRTLPAVERYQAGCVALAFTHDGQGLIGFVSAVNVAGDEPSVLCWDLPTEILRKPFNWELGRPGPGRPVLHLCHGDKQVLIQGEIDSSLCDVTGPEVRERQEFQGPTLCSHDGTHLAVLTAGADRLWESPKPSWIGKRPDQILLVDLADSRGRMVYRSSGWEKNSPTPRAFAPDDRALAVYRWYGLFGDRWYDRGLKWLIDVDHPLYLCDVESGRCLARLPGEQVIFTPDSKAVIVYGPDVQPTIAADGTPHFPHADVVIRVYDYPMRVPVAAILMWSLLPTAATVILLGGLQYLRRSRARPMPGQPDPSVGPGGGEVADGRTVGRDGPEV